MFPHQLGMVREMGRFESPVDFVKAIIPFTFVHSWIKPPLFWKVSQLPRPNSPLDINVCLQLQIIRLPTTRLFHILLLSRCLFPNPAVPSLFPTNHWLDRVLSTLFRKSQIPMFFSSPRILLSLMMVVPSQTLRRIAIRSFPSRGATIWFPHQVVRSCPSIGAV